MEKAYESKYHSLEKTYWWFVARRDMMLRLARSAEKQARILDIGCASGQMMQLLKANGFSNITGIDVSKDAILACKDYGIRNVLVMDAKGLAFPDSSFDAILASDVLEHIKDDAAALCDWNRALAHGGRLIIFVPAFDFLWSRHDDTNQHHCRYSKSELLRLLRQAGFSVERVSYWNFGLFFPIYLARLLKKNSGGDDLRKINPATNKLLTGLLKLENHLLSLTNFPVGVSLFAVCRKK
jgi:SAM-dependent methyltransferase